MFDLPNVWGAPEWRWPAIAMVALLAALLVWGYARTGVAPWVRWAGAAAKLLAVVLLVLMLLEPQRSDTRPVPGANLFLVMADNSQSLHIRDGDQAATRGERLKQRLADDEDWQVRLAQDFDVRRYLFDRRLRPVGDFAHLAADGAGSSIAGSLAALARRYAERPTAGILLFTDGNATDAEQSATDSWAALAQSVPPVYPVVLGTSVAPKDISVTRLTVSQTNFEAAPVTVAAEVIAHGFAGEDVAVELLDEKGERLERQVIANVEDDKPFAVRFRTRPERSGVAFYSVRATGRGTRGAGAEASSQAESSGEATLENNLRYAAADRGGGPYRVLYVAGRPNWEFKFLRRSLADDPEVALVGLVRIANREPRFKFRDRDSKANPLYQNSSEAGDEQVERYDEPVLVRLGAEDQDELRTGFPKTAEELLSYDAVVLDDVEAEFFTAEQHALLQRFVGQRGGGLLMLGGQESFVKGKYDRTLIGETLPVYVDNLARTPSAAAIADAFRLDLTREGWLQPWVRVRSTESEETRRLAEMPPLKTLNRVSSIKPGASVLARVRNDDGSVSPALVVQRFNRGRTAALLVGDLWRWHVGRKTPDDTEPARAWRQTLRWLVSETPRRVEVTSHRVADDPNQPIRVGVKVYDEQFKPLDNASVRVTVTPPDGKPIELVAEPVDATSGEYATTYVPRLTGTYRAEVVAAAADASEIGRRTTGWTAEPAADEFRSLAANRTLLERIAADTGGEVIELDALDEFVATLPNRKIPVTEPVIYPVWHRWAVLLAVVGLLVGEWGLRRWKGLP